MTQSEQKLETDVLIIGGGPAGIQASKMLRKFEPDQRVMVVRPEDHSMVYCAIPYALEGLFPLERTFKRDALVTDSGAELVRGAIASVEPRDHVAHLEDGRTIGYQKLLIATGASPIRPPLPGIDAENVLTIKTERDTKRVLERLALRTDCDNETESPPQKVVVVGSGAIGIEQAIAYRSNGLEVHLIEMQGHVLPHLLDPDMTAPAVAELLEAGVELHLNTRLEGLDGESAVETVRLSGGETISIDPAHDFVIVAVGMKPDIAFLGVDFERVADGLVVDEQMKTSVPDVWAAGDCVAFHSGIDGVQLGGKLATNAVPMAKVAARSMLGQPARYPGFFNGAVTVVGKLRIGGTGFTEAFARTRGLNVYSSEASTATRFPMMPDAGQVKVKLIIELGSERLVGAQVIGDEAVAERIDLLTFAIQRRTTMQELADLSYSAQPWQTFFPARNAIVDAASAALERGPT